MSSKKLLFNKSSLLSLKAELLKKQEEVLAKKQQPQHKVENYKPPPAKKNVSESDLREPRKSFKDSLNAVDTEELEACKKSKEMLVKKAELYEHLSDGVGNSQLAGRFLVDFSTKKQQETVDKAQSSDDDDAYIHNEGDDEWTEFTDCLGRTRKCLKSDLHIYQQKNEQLSKEVFKERSPIPEPEQNPERTTETEKPFLVQKTNDYLQTLRQKWELKERELLAQDKDIHYQDILFDEARQHGVGYYAFSTDETERQRQMAELKRVREQTMRAQRESEEARKKRDELLAARVAAARARQRARAGLPPEEPKDNTKDFTTCLLEFLNKQKDEADAEAKEKERKIREEKERERQQLREMYVREWDIGKEGIEGKAKRFVEMTQEEYVEQQRSKRIDEFAPPNVANPDRMKYTFDDKGMKTLTEVAKTWAEVRPVKHHSPPPINEVSEQKGLYFSTTAATSAVSSKSSTKYSNFVRPGTSKSNSSDGIAKHTSAESNIKQTSHINDITDKGTLHHNVMYAQPKPPPLNTSSNTTASDNSVNKQNMKYRNFAEYNETATTKPVYIINEVEEDNMLEETRIEDSREIAPPPTYDYYGPVMKKKRSSKPFTSDIHEAYAQGCKSLDAKSTHRNISKQYDFSLE